MIKVKSEKAGTIDCSLVLYAFGLLTYNVAGVIWLPAALIICKMLELILNKDKLSAVVLFIPIWKEPLS